MSNHGMSGDEKEKAEEKTREDWCESVKWREENI